MSRECPPETQGRLLASDAAAVQCTPFIHRAHNSHVTGSAPALAPQLLTDAQDCSSESALGGRLSFRRRPLTQQLSDAEHALGIQKQDHQALEGGGLHRKRQMLTPQQQEAWVKFER